MEESMDKRLAALGEAIEELPEKAREAIGWIITHFDIVEEMCGNSEMTDEEIEKQKEDARAKEDYLMFALLCAAQTIKPTRDQTDFAARA